LLIELSGNRFKRFLAVSQNPGDLFFPFATASCNCRIERRPARRSSLNFCSAVSAIILVFLGIGAGLPLCCGLVPVKKHENGLPIRPNRNLSCCVAQPPLDPTVTGRVAEGEEKSPGFCETGKKALESVAAKLD